MNNDQVKDYLNGLQVDERVIETGESCMTGRTGTVYISQNEATKGAICAMWDCLPGEDGRMGTSVTWGTRRISDCHAKGKPQVGDRVTCKIPVEAYYSDYSGRPKMVFDTGLVGVVAHNDTAKVCIVRHGPQHDGKDTFVCVDYVCPVTNEIQRVGLNHCNIIKVAI
jgi:hypothetical protein